MFVHAPTKSLVLQVPDPFAIRDLLPTASRLINTPQGNIVVRHTIETTRILRNVGLDVPAPIRVHYNWPGKYRPFDHQQIMADAMTMHEKIYNLSEMGTCKTAATLWAADYLMEIGKVKRALILTPLSTMASTWAKDIFDVLLHRRAVIVHGSAERREAGFNMDVDFYICNHDGIALKDVAKLAHKRKDIDLIILDEASVFRNDKTVKWKYLKWVLERKRRFWALTGTPTPHEPADAWALAKLINPDAVPNFKGTFKRQTMVQVPNALNKWVPKKGYEDIVFAALQPAVRFEKRDCLNLPPVITTERQTSMSAEQRVAFDRMRADMVTQIKSMVITAVHAADQITKLRQILCGAVKDPVNGTYTIIDHGPRLQDLRDCIDQASAKVIVIVPFKGIIRALERELAADYSVGVLNGDVTPNARTAVIRDFKTKPDPHILLCHAKVMAHGLNLTEADTIIFYGPIYSNDEYSQVVERFNRPGQTRKMTIVRMAAHPMEWSIYRMVDNRSFSQDNILKLFREVTI